MVAVIAMIFPPHRFVSWLGNRDSAATRRQIDMRVPVGQQAVVQPEPMGTDSSMSPVPRRLILAAVHPGADITSGYADLGVSSLTPQRYAAGALLVNGAKLVEIHRDHVVIERRGERTDLYLDGTGEKVQADLRSKLVVVGGKKSDVAEVDSSEPLTQLFRISPVFDKDQVVGLHVFPGENQSWFRDTGLEEGDRITAIDGKSVSDAAQALVALRKISSGRVVSVSVTRAGVPLIVQLSNPRPQ
jgi:hypothetical protein